MSKRKRNTINGIFLLIVFLLTIYGVFKGGDLSDIAETIIGAKTFYLIMGVTCVVFFIRAESTILHCLFDALRIKTKRRTCFIYSSVGFFFSCITPSAGGSQPAQVYYIQRNMILVPVATVVLVVTTIACKLVLVITGCPPVLLGRGLLNRYVCEAMPVLYLGLTLGVVFYLAVPILAFHTSFAKNIVMKLLGFPVKPHIPKDKTSRTERLNMTMDHYDGTPAYLRQHKEISIRVVFFIFCQRATLLSITYFVYGTFGLTRVHMAALILLQSAISISADMLPLPGGMGASKHLFLTILDPTLYRDLLLPVTALSRRTVYYVQLVFSTAVILITHILINRRQRRA